jgi:hypothetical protein
MRKAKKTAKITLNRETLRTLASGELREPAGGATTVAACLTISICAGDTCRCSVVRTCSCLSNCC